MTFAWQNLVLLIESSDPENDHFGTGFILCHFKGYSYIVTCLHVLEEVGGIDNLLCNVQPAELVCSGLEKKIDIAIIRIKANPEDNQLGLIPLFQIKEQDHCVISGFRKYTNTGYLKEYISCMLLHEAGLKPKRSNEPIKAWSFKVLNDDQKIHPGYSGSPAIVDDKVIGIVAFKEGVNKGLIISIESVKKIWSDPVGLQYWEKGINVPSIEHNVELKNQIVDWGTSPEIYKFYGRKTKIANLIKLVQNENCKLIAVLGKRGIGKTLFALNVAKIIHNQYDFTCWRSLINAPSLNNLIIDLIKSFIGEIPFSLQLDNPQLITYFINIFKENRCLIILDNFESILLNNCEFKEAYEDYQMFLISVSEIKSDSCLVLTSRLKPKVLAAIEGKLLRVRSFLLDPLKIADCKSIFSDVSNYVSNDDGWIKINSFYGGNPLMLKLTASYIKDIYFGKINKFLSDRQSIKLVEVTEYLDWYYDNLTKIEKSIMFWLAIEREPLTLDEIKDNIIIAEERTMASKALSDLDDKLLIEKGHNRFSLLPVFIEYFTDKFVKEIISELKHLTPYFLHNHTLSKAYSKEFIKICQKEFILIPLKDKIDSLLGEATLLTNCTILIENSKKNKYFLNTYIGGNILNILSILGISPSKIDFSNLKIWQADLQISNLENVNFSYCDFYKSLFYDSMGGILTVSISHDEKTIIAGDDKGFIHSWSSSSFSKMKSLFAHDSWVRFVQFNQTDKLFASASSDYKIKLWDINSYEETAVFEGHSDQIYSIDFSSNNKLLASCSEDKHAIIWNIENGKKLAEFIEPTSRIRFIKFSPDSNYLAYGGNNVVLWEIDSKIKFREFERLNTYVRWLVYLDEGNTIAVATNDGIVSIWDINTNRLICTFLHPDKVWSIGYDKKRNVIISVCEDGFVRFWDLLNEKLIRSIFAHKSGIRSLAIGMDTDYFVTGGADNAVKIWSLENGECLRSIKGYSNALRSIVIKNNKFYSVGEDGVIRMWSLDSQEESKFVSINSKLIEVIQISPKFTTIVSGGQDKLIYIWNENLNFLFSLKHHTEWIWDLKFMNKNDIILASASRDKSIVLWDLKYRKVIKVLNGHEDEVHSISFSYDDRWLISGSDDNSIIIWDLANYNISKKLTSNSNCIRCVHFSNNSYEFLSCGDDNLVKLWSIELDTYIQIYSGHVSKVRDVIFLSDNLIGSCSDDCTIRLWEKGSGICIKVLEGHLSRVNRILRNGEEELISCSEDGTIKLWNLTNYDCITTFVPNRPYENMLIQNITGLTESEIKILIDLGAQI